MFPPKKKTHKSLSARVLRRLGYKYDGKSQWTDAHLRYLRNLKLPYTAHNLVLEDNLTTIDFHMSSRPRGISPLGLSQNRT